MGDRAGLPAELRISKDPSKLVSFPDSSLRISFLLMKRSLLSTIARFLLVMTTGTMGCVRGAWNVSSRDLLPLVFSRSVDNISWTDRGTSYVKDNPTPGSSIGLSPRVTGERQGGGDPPDSAVDDVTRAPSETETTGINSSSPSPPLSPVGRADWTEASSFSTVSDRPTFGSATRLAISYSNRRGLCLLWSPRSFPNRRGRAPGGPSLPLPRTRLPVERSHHVSRGLLILLRPKKDLRSLWAQDQEPAG